MVKKALFLDRDGVINKEINYLFKIEDVEFVPGIFDLCRYFTAKDFLIIVITNQAGIARGYYTNDDFQNLTDWMKNEFGKNGIKLEHVYHCPHHPQFSGDCDCRKPKPGMILDAQKKFNLDLKHSVLIGDEISDIESGRSAGVGSNILIKRNILKPLLENFGLIK